MKNYPKISIVTINYNGGTYLEETIESVINQDYPNLEYILIDGGSTDNSLDIIKKYQSHFSYWESSKDEGQYFAIQKGFQKCTGDIMAWISSDDKYLPKAFFVVADIFTKFPETNWLMGQAREYTEFGALVGRITIPWCRWSKYRYYTNDFQFIQQESCFWSKELWEKAGAKLDTSYKLAGDMELWARFFRFEKLHTTTFELAGFRHRKDEQRSKDFLHIYLEEAKKIIRREKKVLSFKIRLILPIMNLIRWFLGPFFFFDSLLINKIYPFLFGIPTLINYDFDLHDYVRSNVTIQHPPMVLGKRQIHRKTLRKKNG
ncbi:MAG: glycosyltransferase [Flavobacteriales bacterium]|nr:glycosyltransferase [Flavobacteriales bacterium]